MSTPTLDDRRRIIETIGHELVADATEPQRLEILRAIDENEAGVKQLAASIRANPRVHKPVPVLLSKLRAGAHQAPTRSTDQKLSKLEQAHRLYIAKLADLSKHDALKADDEKPDAWSPAWTVDDAVAYAVTCVDGDSDLEDALRRRAGLPAYLVADQPPREALEAIGRLAQRLGRATKPPPAVVAAAPIDDDIPGYGDHT